MESKKSVTEDASATPAGLPAKKAYTAPTLIEYGTVAKLTASGSGTIVDAMVTMGNMP